jgi:hypothetical protein
VLVRLARPFQVATIAAFVVGTLALFSACAGATSPTVFTTLQQPEGITIGLNGNLFVSSDGLFTSYVTKFSPTGQVLGQVSIGGITVGEIGHLATDPATGTIWDISHSGTLRVIDPKSLAVQTLGDVKTVDVSQSTQSIYDVLLDFSWDQTGTVIPPTSSFGDIALYRSASNTRLDVFVTARTVNVNVPYVLRLTWLADASGALSYQGASAVVMSSARSIWGTPRGIAVSPSGLVVTSLPRLGLMNEGFVDQLISFPYNFPESGGSPTVELSRWDMTSIGIASDSQGWFDVTSQIGSSLCEKDSGAAIAVLGSEREFRACYPHSLLGAGEDVAVTPSGGDVYSTIRNENEVLEWGRLDGFSLFLPKAGSGEGTVTSTPAGIDCGTKCIAVFDNGAQVTLHAAPAPGSTFDGWSGGDCSGTDDCVVTMDAAKRVTANFRSFDAPVSADYLTVPLVPDFRQTISGTQCQARGGSTSTHGVPLALTACNPPALAPGAIAHFGTRGSGAATLAEIPGDLSTPFNEADLAVSASMSDIRSGSRTGPVYDPNPLGPDVTVAYRFRISDTYNGSNLNLPATMQDVELTLPVSCSQTFDPTLGASCSVSTGLNALVPDVILEGQRTVLQAFRARVRDSGADGVRGNADDKGFAMQGLAVH